MVALKVFGPAHAYASVPVPLVGVDVRPMDAPTQKGPIDGKPIDKLVHSPAMKSLNEVMLSAVKVVPVLDLAGYDHAASHLATRRLAFAAPPVTSAAK